MRTVHAAVSALAILIGAVHVGGTFVFYSRFDAAALWFLGSGLFVISLGLLNIGVIRSERDRVLRSGTAVLNAAGCVVGLLSIPRVGGPPSYALTVIFLVATLLVLFGYRAGVDERERGIEG